MARLHINLLSGLFVLLCVLGCIAPDAHADDVEDFFHAVTMDDATEIQSLLQRGINPNVTDKSLGNTGLIVALLEKSMKVFDVLVNAPGIDIDAKAKNGNSALMVAAYKGNQAAFDVLLKKGAAVNRPDWTPLHYAAAGGQNKIVQILLDKGADINARSPNLTTPLMIAAYEGFDLTAQLLLDRGADVTLKNEVGQNAADYAKRLGRQDIINLVNDYMQKARKPADEPVQVEF